MEQDNANVSRLENMRESFYTALELEDWDQCRTLLTDIEYMKQSTWEMRRDMNIAMGEEDADFDGIEHEQKESEARESSHEHELSSQAEGYGY